MNDLKEKKNKKTQTASKSEPVDLEAGRHVDEPDAADVTKAVYDVPGASVLPHTVGAAKEETAAESTDTFAAESSKGDTMSDDSTPAASEEPSKTTRTDVPPPPKIKITSPKDTYKTVQDNDAEPNSADVVMPDSSKAKTIKDRTNEDVTEYAVDVAGSGNVAPKSKDSVTPESATAGIVMGNQNENRCLIHLVSTWSFAPEPPKKSIATEATTAKIGHENAAVASTDVPDPSLLSEAEQDVMSKTTAVPGPSTPKKATKSHGLPPLPPFNHEAFSHVNNIRRLTVKIFALPWHIQQRPLARPKPELPVLPEHVRSDIPPKARRFSQALMGSQVEFQGHHFDLHPLALQRQLPNRNHRQRQNQGWRCTSALAEQYVLRDKLLDDTYRNDIMEYFVTIHVWTRKLTFCSVMDVVYNGTNPGSPMRQLLADMHAFIVIDDVGKLEMMDDMPEAFVKDVLKRVLVVRPNGVDDWRWYLKKTGKMYH
ncbi:hypothetical protein BU25DRAFT_456324 [Macroventuria anomochaeta]|uniref:Uncharacterized protein n=1 Tax=Macroventuria anomochaeta TaxID=301207 RepID=A0ACB6S787_9PLEO|nr:uncharacterized protein BU25DRAFT_456324 [Macroventuria anomochaeta]KAF2629898.1 hypothetical protein BU25DRAFT_456324 [Macroventuria anomochaeta]